MDTSKADRVEKIYAWLIPEAEDQALVAIDSKGKSFGFHAKENDVALKNTCAAEKQARINWDGENLCLRDLGGNGFTLLNGKAVGEQPAPVYHDETISVAFERFRVFRRDGLKRPEENYIARFSCDGELIEEQTCKKSAAPVFPNMPEFREEPDGVIYFSEWVCMDQQGASVVRYEARYEARFICEDPEKKRNTVSGKGKLLLTNNRNFNVLTVPKTGLRIGGSKICEFYFPGEKALAAELDADTCELHAYVEGFAEVNGEPVRAGSAVTVNKADRLTLGSRSYTVAGTPKDGQKKTVPVLMQNGKVRVRLDELKDGGSIMIGRECQREELGHMAFIGREHASIRCENGKYFIKDNMSKNGTSVIKAGSTEEQRLSGDTEMQIEAGDTIRLFVIDFVFGLEEI